MCRLLASAFFFLGLGLMAPPAEAQRSGNYTVAGRNLDGSDYTGRAALDQVGSASFTVVWQVAGRTIRGVGMVAGHSFAVVYGAANQPALGIYQLQPDGRLVGTWTVVGAAGTGEEVMTPEGEAAADPTPPVPQP